MPVFLHGLVLQYYRGIGSEMQYIAPFSDINIFVGANNSGKSTVLNYIADHLNSCFKQGRYDPKLSPVEVYRGAPNGNLASGLGYPTTKVFQQAKKAAKQKNFQPQEIEPVLKIIETMAEALAVNGAIWAVLPENRNAAVSPLIAEIPPRAFSNIKDNSLARVVRKLTGVGNVGRAGFASSFVRYFCKMLEVPTASVSLIPANRELGPKTDAFEGFGGKGLINRLAELQNPGLDKLDDRKRFEKINEFLRDVTGKPDAQIEIPHDKEYVHVHMVDKILPLSSLGTDIHEVVLIASYCTLQENAIVCIEEPEIHLHPLLQRKLIEYLRENTKKQYFIATHSAAFIDSADAAVFHVTNDGSQTRVRNVSLKKERRQLCNDLGYKASDIVQANAVIWVEGPSDRIYLRHWIRVRMH